mmetsp:Transcript_44353/g.125233  ORF Transcript_44353/g.125233 Transcript_44353/m.125233 type:complete len:225 (-) Transcript_44353:191-865(-)
MLSTMTMASEDVIATLCTTCSTSISRGYVGCVGSVMLARSFIGSSLKEPAPGVDEKRNILEGVTNKNAQMTNRTPAWTKNAPMGLHKLATPEPTPLPMPADVPAKPSHLARASDGALRCTQTVAQTLMSASVIPMPNFAESMSNCITTVTGCSCNLPKTRQQAAFQKRPTMSSGFVSYLMRMRPHTMAVVTWPNLSIAPSMPSHSGDQPLLDRAVVQNCVAPPS